METTVEFAGKTVPARRIEGCLWLRQQAVGAALGYRDAGTLWTVFCRNPEFTQDMTRLVAPRQHRRGNSKGERFYSIGAAYLFAMNSVLVNGPAGRRWLLKLLCDRITESQAGLQADIVALKTRLRAARKETVRVEVGLVMQGRKLRFVSTGKPARG